MITRSLGGGANGGAPGVQYGVGLNNQGLLVKICGVVSSAGQGYFYISDGSKTTVGPLVVEVICPSGVNSPANNAFVEVTGISSSDSNSLRVVRVRKATDIVTIH